MMPAWLSLVAVVFSGLFSAIASVAATIWYNFWAERRRLKIECLRQLMRHKIDDPEFLKAFNEIPVIFAGRRRVLAAQLAALDTILASNSVHGDHMVNLIKVIAADLRIRGVSDRQLTARFSSKGGK